jgi:hypothetical protein
MEPNTFSKGKEAISVFELQEVLDIVHLTEKDLVDISALPHPDQAYRDALGC